MLMPHSFASLSSVLLSTIFACSSPTAPGFSAKFGAPELNSQSERADVTAGNGQIVVTGKLTVPDPCYSGAARLEESGMTMTIHLTAGSHSQGACVAAIAYLAYTVTISATGLHEVVVVHETVGLTPPPREMARVQLTVP
jgi:hypothetical protein